MKNSASYESLKHKQFWKTFLLNEYKIVQLSIIRQRKLLHGNFNFFVGT